MKTEGLPAGQANLVARKPGRWVQFLVGPVTETAKVAQGLNHALGGVGVIALTGNLGSGKTTFTQYLSRELGIEEAVVSPTFTLIHDHLRPDGGSFIHGDFYRLTVEEIRRLGITDYFDQPKTLTVVEWADRLASLFPPTTLWLNFELGTKHRLITATSDDPLFWANFRAKL